MLLDGQLSAADQAALSLTREFADSCINEENVARWYKEGGIPDSVMRSYRDSGLGYLGIPASILNAHNIPSALEVSTLGQMMIVEELSRRAGATLPFQSQIYSLNTFSQLANKEQMELVFSHLEQTGRICFSSAISDVKSGSDLFGTSTAVVEKDGKLLLSGQKAFVGHGEHAPYILVFAKNTLEAKEGTKAPLSAWLIPTRSAGVRTFPISKVGQKMIDSAAIVFTDVEVESSWQVGLADNTLGILESVINLGRCVICAASLGMAQAAFEDASHWAATHKIRDKRLGDFQQIDLLLAEMACKIFNMRAHVYHTASLLKEKRLPTYEVALMKKYVPAAAVEVADAAMQIFGGMGYTDATRAARIWIDCRGNQYVTGTDQIMVNLISREILNRYS